MSYYFWILLGTIAGPLLLSFDKKVHFYTHWKSFAIATIIVASGFLIWDEYFTQLKVWGFTPKYLSGIYLGHLPLEEVLFFVLVPYACLFIHEVLKAYFPQLKLDLLGKIFSFTFIFSGLLLALTHLEQWYTLSACSIAALLLIRFAFQLKVSWLGNFALTYLVALIPFFVVNGLLTGIASEQPVVWYTKAHITGVRLTTIPLEDLYYNLCMLLPIIAIHEWLRAKNKAKG